MQNLHEFSFPKHPSFYCDSILLLRYFAQSLSLISYFGAQITISTANTIPISVSMCHCFFCFFVAAPHLYLEVLF